MELSDRNTVNYLMKILVLIHEFPPVGGGGGRVAKDIAAGLVKLGHQVRVISTHMQGLPNQENIEGVIVDRLPTIRKTAYRAEFFDMAHFNLSAIQRGRKIIQEWKPDVIHAHFAVPAGAVALILSKLSGIPYVLTAHLGDVPGAVPEKTDKWFRWIYPFTPPIWKNANRVVAVSEFTKQMALAHYSIAIDVIPNGVELTSLPNSNVPTLTQVIDDDRVLKPAQLVTNDKTVRIVFAGRFMEQKNPEHLVDALFQLSYLPWRCAMLGDGPLLDSIREKIEKSGLSDRFQLPGWMTPEQVINEFSQSDVLVLPSRSEGLSVVGVQALAMGLAMILSDVGGNLELVSETENGFLFPVGDVEMLTKRLKHLLENPEFLRSARAKSFEKAQKYDLQAIVSRYEEIFLKIESKK